MLDVPTVSALPAAHTVELSISGMTCAACAARVEKKLTRIAPGVVAAVNFATERATVTAPEDVPVQTMITAVQDAGYAAGLIEPAAEPLKAGDQAAYLRRRLILALVFFVPLSDLSITLSLFPGYRFTGWQWVLIALTAPVALWAAWPFHRAAMKNARHGASSMDTLVSLGVVAACGWSVYAMFRPAGGGIYLEVAAAVTTFLLAGRYYEARARSSAAGAMRKLAAAAARDGCVLGGIAREQPAGPGYPRGDEHQRDEDAGHPVGQPLDGGLVRLGPADQRDQLGQLGVLADLDGPDHQPPGQRDGSAGNRVASRGLDREGFTGHHAPVHRGLAGQHLAVGRDLLPRADHEGVPAP